MYLGEFAKHARSAEKLRHRARQGFVLFNGYPMWSPEEDETCKRLYPDYHAIQEALPHRTLQALSTRCRNLGIQEKRRFWTAADNSRFRRMYKTASAEELRSAFPDVKSNVLHARGWSLGLSRPKQPYVSTGDALLDELRSRCWRQSVTMPDLDVMIGGGLYFKRKRWRGRCGTIKYNAIIPAIKAMGGHLHVEWRDE